MKTKRLPITLIVFVLWVVITLVGGMIKNGGQAELSDAVTKGLAWPILAAAVFIIGVVIWQGWSDVGLRQAPKLRDFRLAWLPLLYILGALGFSVSVGLPPAQVLIWTLINTLIVGVSEEVMFRGAILQAFRHRFSILTAVLLTSVMFGAVHSLNAFGTGEVTQALIQSCAAFLSGLIFIALRLRTGSIWPSIIIHGLWDFATFTLGASGGSQSVVPEPASGILLLLLPLLFVLPNALLGIFLMRNIRRDNVNPES